MPGEADKDRGEGKCCEDEQNTSVCEASVALEHWEEIS